MDPDESETGDRRIRKAIGALRVPLSLVAA
jgi:hypothetical protein